MKRNYVLKTASIFFLSFLFVYIGFYFTSQRETQEKFHFHKVLMIKPNDPIIANQLIKVDIDVYDGSSADEKILKVTFDDTELPLKKKDPTGDRGSFHLQVKPGTHEILWTTKAHKYLWPRSKIHKKTITTQPNIHWVHIQIIGSEITVS